MSTAVVVVGQGYVGLPLALGAAEVGCTVVGVDEAVERVTALNAGESPIGDVDSDQLKAALQTGRYRASAEYAAVADAAVVLLCVPTPYHNDAPDLSYVERAAKGIGPHLRPGVLVVLESTTFPGTTEELLAPILADSSGLRPGTDFHLAFSPERIDPGNPRFGLRNTPKIVGGLTPECTAQAAAFYRRVVDEVVEVSNPRAAEMAKLLENTFRHINIALVNELAILSQDLDVDVWEVIDAAASKPFGFMPFYPGPGVGGHCIPVDPMYLSWRVRQFGGSAKFIELARDVNAAMPSYVVTRIQELLNDRERSLKGSHILVVGVSYKANVADMRESPALPLIERLRQKGCEVSFHDPHVPVLALSDEVELKSQDLTPELLERTDCVLICTAHDAVDYEALAQKAALVFDTRNVVPAAGSHVVKL